MTKNQCSGSETVCGLLCLHGTVLFCMDQDHSMEKQNKKNLDFYSFFDVFMTYFEVWCKCTSSKELRKNTKKLEKREGSGSGTERNGTWIQINNFFKNCKNRSSLASMKDFQATRGASALQSVHPALQKINFLIGISVTFFPFWIRILILNLDPNLQNCSYLYVKNVASNSQSQQTSYQCELYMNGLLSKIL